MAMVVVAPPEGVGLGVFVFVLALLLALMEVEMEGQHGWAEKLPTFYRVSGKEGVKPLTGYHLFMMALFLFFFHFPFLLGTGGPRWSLAAEAGVVNAMVSFFACEDFLWFVFNPFYGWKRFKKRYIWWHNEPWVLGMAPVEFFAFPAASLTFAHLVGVLQPAAIAMATAWVCVAVSIFTLAPAYGAWYVAMRREDHRSKAPIFHRLPPASTTATAPEAPPQVLQTDFSPGSGDALAACVASAHGLGISGVPNFIAAPEGYLAALQEWLAPRGLGFLKVKLEGGRTPFPAPAGSLCLLAGKSPRGDHKHVVLARVAPAEGGGGGGGGGLVPAMDPHPDGTMIEGEGEWAGFFVAVDARRLMVDLSLPAPILASPVAEGATKKGR